VTRSPAGFVGLLAPADRAAFDALGFARHYRRGAQLAVQGDRRDTVFVITSGRVKVTLDAGDGRHVVVSILGRGDLVGEFEAIEGAGHPRAGSSVALEDVACRAISAEAFRAYLDHHPQAALVLLRVVIRRLRAADRRRRDSGSLDAPHRLARLLLEQVELADVDLSQHAAGDPIELDLPLTQDELAGVIGASRESVVRALTALRDRDLITTARRRITIRDHDGLRHFADDAPERSSDLAPGRWADDGL
jgi:CRP-like cAMP-binding protein